MNCDISWYILCISYVYLMYILCISYVYLMYILCISYVYLMYILCISYVYLMYILCISYVYLMYILCISYVYLMYILCISYVYLMYILCISYVYLMYILCISYVYLMYILCISYVYLMYILCISYVYLMYILCIRISKLFKYWISTYRWLPLVNLWRRRVHQKKKRGIGASWKTEFQHKWWDFVSKIGWFGIWKNNELCIFWYLTGPVPLIAGPISSELSGSRNHHSNTMAPWLFPRPGPPMVRLEELSQTLGFSKEKDFHLQSIPQLGEICFASGESCYSHGWNRWFQWNSWEWHGHIQNNGYDIIGKDDSDLLV